MPRRWLLALLASFSLAVLLVPVLAQDAKKDETKKDAKDKDAKDKDAKDKDAKDKDKKDKDAKDKDAKDKDAKDKDAKDKDAKDKDAKDKDTKKDDKKDPKDGEADLSWGFKENKEFYQKMVTNTEQTMVVSSNTVIQKQEQTFYFKWLPVKKTADGGWEIKQTIIGVKMKIVIGNQEILYDSTAKDPGANNPLAEFFKALKDSEFTLTLSKDYKVVAIEGREAFITKLTNANPQMKPLLEAILSEKAMKEMADPTFAALPNMKKKKGESWGKKTSLDMGPIGKYENEYTFTYFGNNEKEKKLHQIDVVTTLSYKEPGDTPGPGTLPFKIKSADLKTSKATGTILYDPDLQLISQTTMALELKGTLTIDIGGQPTTVELTQKQTSEVTTSLTNPVPTKPS